MSKQCTNVCKLEGRVKYTLINKLVCKHSFVYIFCMCTQQQVYSSHTLVFAIKFQHGRPQNKCLFVHKSPMNVYSSFNYMLKSKVHFVYAIILTVQKDVAVFSIHTRLFFN